MNDDGIELVLIALMVVGFSLGLIIGSSFYGTNTHSKLDRFCTNKNPYLDYDVKAKEESKIDITPRGNLVVSCTGRNGIKSFELIANKSYKDYYIGEVENDRR